MGKVVIKISQGSAVTQTVLGGLIHLPRLLEVTEERNGPSGLRDDDDDDDDDISSGCNFIIVYLCQKLWKLAGSRQSYCKNCQAYFFGPPCRRPGRLFETRCLQCCCPRSSRTNFQVLVLVLVLEARLLVLVLVIEPQVLDNNTAFHSTPPALFTNFYGP